MMSKTSSSAGSAARARRSIFLRVSHAFAAALLVATAPVAFAIQPVTSSQRVAPQAAPHAQDLDVQPELETSVGLVLGVSPHAGVDTFLTRNKGEWEMRWDRRADRPELIQGSGIALIPGKGNALTASSLGLPANEPTDIAVVETRLRDFIAANDDLLRSRGLEFRLDPESSVPYGDGSTHWFVEFAQYAHDIRVKDAHLFFRISHGNIVQFGSHLVAPVKIDATPVSTAANAFDLAVREMAFPAGSVVKDLIEPGELSFVPVAANGANVHDAYLGADGAGYAHRLVWRFVFRIDGNAATYEVLFDAKSNRLVDVRDLNDYVSATVSGGIYPTTNTDAEVVVPFPYTTVTNGSAKITDALGIYDYAGGSATLALNGQYFRIVDTCGSISLANSTDGDLNLGTSAGTDCTTPGFGGAGNTHASRTGFYHLTKINEKARAILPTNTWLKSKVTANMNLNQVCNAYWDGSALNFFKSGTSTGGTFCSDTGEIAAVFLHEWGHGLDTNTGGAASEYGSGEAVGDTFAFLETKDACIGKNFTPSKACHNCNATCTGVRDMSAFALGGSHTIATPANVTSTTGIDCNAYLGLNGIACPYNRPDTGTAYRGPMGWEGHCESYIASTANWDLAQALVTRFGTADGYTAMDRIWYGSLTPSKSAYRIASGGTCNVNATVDGCGSNNWYTVFLAADDDDGNLSNGTPNACRIWDAFNAHGIACGTRPACSGDAPDFTLNVPTPSQLMCAPGSTTYTVDIGSALGFSNPVTFATSGAPTGITATVSPNPAAPGSSATLTVNATGAATAGTSTITISGTAPASAGHSANVQLQVAVGVPGAPVQTAPANNATGVARTPAFSWAADPAAITYTVEIATDSAFANIVASGTSNTSSWTPASALAPTTTYYWRVRSNSPCGNSANSPTFTFTTGVTFPEPYCAVTFPSSVEPITRVNFTGINNPSSATVGGSPALEDFLGVAGGAAIAGQSYPIAIEGNTAGSFSTYISVYADWNHDGTFGTGEKYDIGVITNSTGADGKQATGTVAVPAGALSGNTRFRVIKKYSSSVAYPTACNTAGYGQAEDYTVTVQAAGSNYTIGGTASGLTASGLKLSLNSGAQTLDVASGATTFQFANPVPDNSAYDVQILAQPTGLTCSLSGNTGTVSGGNVTSVAVNCAPTPTYTIGGTVSGLTASGLKLSLNGGAQTLDVASGASSFQFANAVANGIVYNVEISTQPSSQICSVSGGSGTVSGGDVTSIAVTCASIPTYTIGGTVSGLTGSGLKLSLNGNAQTLDVASGATSFQFANPVADGTHYTVEVITQPTGLTCAASSNSGDVTGGNVTNVSIVCTPQAATYSVGGTIIRLSSAGMVLSLNDTQTMGVSANVTAFTFPGKLPDVTAYSVKVQTQPAGLFCTVRNGTGTIAGANVTDVVVDCLDRIFANGFDGG